MKLASINVERSKHLERVAAFLKKHTPDVLCLQELCARDVARYEDWFGQAGLYVPITRHPAEVDLEPIGGGIFSRYALTDTDIHYYRGAPETLPVISFDPSVPQHVPLADSLHQVLVSATIAGIRVATTHLTVTFRGEASAEQLALAEKIVDYAQGQIALHGHLVLCGDFNAPRGRATFDLLAGALTDCIPTHYTSSIDANLHRAGAIPYMVDGFFCGGAVHARDVALYTGVSDHCAVMGTLSLTAQ